MDAPSFQRSLFPQLHMPTQGEVHDVLSPHYPLLWHAIMDPWDEFLEYRATDKHFADLTEDETAQWLTIQATHRARQFFDGKPGFRLITRYRKLVILLEERLAITIKKLTKRSGRRGEPEKMIRSNYLTPTNQDYWDQRQTGDGLDVPRVILGYMLLKEITEVSVLIAYPRSTGLGMMWAYKMPKQGTLAPEALTPRVAAEVEQQPEKGFVIAPADQNERSDEQKDTGTE